MKITKVFRNRFDRGREGRCMKCESAAEAIRLDCEYEGGTRGTVYIRECSRNCSENVPPPEGAKFVWEGEYRKVW